MPDSLNRRGFVHATGNYVNNASIGATRTMTVIPGRIAAYGEEPVTWDEMVRRAEPVDAGVVM